MELEGGVGVPPANSVLKKYTWGLDLASLGGAGPGGVGILPASLESAGGIGGLLAMEDVQDPNDPNDSLSYVYLYDANGNVGQLIDWNHDPNDPAGAIVAAYEYDPYGNVTAASGSYAADNPLRFSTKYWDDETALGYWGQRYYNPALGRWLNRDPLEELGGVNLYAYAGNDPADRFDATGQMWFLWPRSFSGRDQDFGDPCPKKSQSQWDPPADGESMNPGVEGLRPPPPKVCDHSEEGDCKKACDNPNNGGVTMCDGLDGAMCCVCPSNIHELTRSYERLVQEQAETCIDAHEAAHVDAGNRRPPHGFSPCYGKRAGENPGTDTECAAYAAEFACLSRPKERCIRDPQCVADLKTLLSERRKLCEVQCGKSEMCFKMEMQALAALNRQQQQLGSIQAPAK